MQKNSYPGKFIVIEGLDGSGHSTQVSLLRDFLLKEDKETLLTKEPTRDSEAGRKIKEILEEKVKIEPMKLQELFAEDRKEHLEKLIIPALKENKNVISDRYFFSTFGYGAAEGLDLERLIEMNNNFLLPDLTFILKVRPETCIERIEKRGETITLFEKQEKLAKVWHIYEQLPNRFENVYMIDGEEKKEEVFSQIKELVLSKIIKNKINKEI